MMKTDDLSEVRELYLDEVLEMLREDGIVVGRVVMSWPRFFMRCHLLGCDPDRILVFLS